MKLTKTPLIYSVPRFNLGGLGALFWGAKPTKDLRGDGTGYSVTGPGRCWGPQK